MKYLLLILLIFPCLNTNAQRLYNYDWKTESLIIGPSILMIGSSYVLDFQKTPLSDQEIITAVPSINRFDRIALKYQSKSADLGSDFLFYATSLAPVLFLGSQEMKGERLGYLLMLGETVSLNAGITLLTKSISDRPRPFFFNDEFSIEERRDLDARKAFFSGHTSHTAAVSFFFANCYDDLYPQSSWKKVIWSGAAVIPAITAYLRVRAGKHYPSDVIVGYVVGAGAGTLIPFLHRKKAKASSVWKVNFQGNGFRMTYQIK